MAITKQLTEDKIEIVGNGIIQVRTLTRVLEDGVEISRSFSRHVVQPYTLTDVANNTWTATDITGQSTKVQAICNAAWTTEVKQAFYDAVTEVPEDDS